MKHFRDVFKSKRQQPSLNEALPKMDFQKLRRKDDQDLIDRWEERLMKQMDWKQKERIRRKFHAKIIKWCVIALVIVYFAFMTWLCLGIHYAV